MVKKVPEVEYAMLYADMSMLITNTTKIKKKINNNHILIIRMEKICLDE